MQFDTNSVWIIVLTLLLITIFIVVWYFYQELLEAKRKTKSTYENTNIIHKRLQDIEDKLTEPYLEEENDDFEESEYSNYEPSEEENDEMMDKLLESLQEETENTTNLTEVTEAEDKEIEEIPNGEEVTSTGCSHIMISGKRKGLNCGKKILQDGKCSQHL